MKTKIVLSLCFFTCFLQTAFGQCWSFGLEAGYIRSMFKSSELESSAKNGFKISGLAGYCFKNNLFLETGIAFQQKDGGLKREDIDFQCIQSVKLGKMNYLGIPLLAGYKAWIGKSLYILPQAGAYMNVGIGGSGTMTGVDRFGQPYEAGIDIFSAPTISIYSPFERIDAGMLFALSLQCRRFGLKLAYELGMNSVHGFFGSFRNRTWSTLLIYRF